MIRAKSRRDRVRAIDFVDHDAVHDAGLDIGQQSLQCRAVHVGAGVAAVIVLLWKRHPTFLALAVDE